MSDSLGETLRKARQNAGFTLRDVERATKNRLSNGHLSLLEGDEVKQPSPHHLHLLAEVLKLDYGRLMKLAGYVIPGEKTVGKHAESAGISDKTTDFTSAELTELQNYVEYIRSKRPRTR